LPHHLMWLCNFYHPVHLELFRDAPSEWHDESLASDMSRLRDCRAAVQEAVEPMRKNRVIGSSLEAEVSIPADENLAASLTRLGIARSEKYKDPADPNDTLADMLIISNVELSSQVDEIGVFSLTAKTQFRKCERSWKYFRADADEDITPRDAAAVSQWDAMNE